MYVKLGNVTLDVKVGVKLAVRDDGVIEIAPDAGPVRPRTNGATSPTPEEAREEAVHAAAAEAEEAEQHVIDVLTRLPDPHKWRTYSEMMRLVYPGVPHRRGDYPTHEYNVLNMTLKRLRSHGVEVCKAERSDGVEGRRNLYRLHKKPEPQPEASAMPGTETYMNAGHG